MLLLRQALGLLSIVYIELFLLLECNAAVDTEEIGMKYFEDDHDRFYLKQSRKLLGVGDNQIIHLNSSTFGDDRQWVWFFLSFAVVLFFLLLIKCCIKLARDEYETNSEITEYPPRPPRRIQPSTTSYARSSRPLAPPRTTSRSLILMPDSTVNSNVFLAIDNPNYTLYAIDLHTHEQRNPQLSNQPIQDLPPDYNSIVRDNQQNNDRSTHAVNNNPSDIQESEKTPPPKYEDIS